MTGQITAGQVLGNAGATLGLPTGTGLSPLFDRAFGAPSQQGTVLNRRELTWSATAVPVFGFPGTTRGTLGLAGLTSGTVTVRTKDVAGTWTMTLPDTGGSANFVLATDGSGICSWSNPASGGTVTSVGLVAPAEFTVTVSPISTTGSLTFTKATQAANIIWAGPTTGAAAQPTFRALVGADLPNPGASSLGGVQSLASVGSRWINQISTSGVPSATQPAFTDISGSVAASQLPNPSASTLGGIQSLVAVTSKWIDSISTSGVPSATQPTFSDISGTIAQAQLSSISNNTVIANVSGGSTFPTPTSPTAILDIIASTQGDILYRNASAWVALTPGTNGQVLTTSGASANPTWTTVTGTGTVTNVASGTGLTGGPITTTGTLALANIANNKVMANVSGGSAAPIPNDPTSILDIIGATEGQILYRGASAWTALSPGTSGQVLQTQGAGATPQWANAGAVSSVSTGWGVTGGPITSSGTISVATANPPYGFDTAINLQLNATVGSNLLTIAVKGNNGSDPSATNPVLIPFRDSTIANGGPVWVALTSALSISTNATGATLGTANTVPFRIWVVAFNNAGTAVLALWQSVTGGASPTAISTLDESTPQSTTPISGSATSPGVFYTPNGTTLTSKAFRILGYMDYASGLTTAGTYASAPTTAQLFGPGIKKPGDDVQRQYKTDNISVTATSLTLAGPAVSISLTSAPNVVVGEVVSSLFGASGQPFGALMRGGTLGTQIGVPAIATQAVITAFNTMGWDRPGTTSSTSYQGAVKLATGSGSAVYGNVNVNPQNSIEITEIMV